MNYRISSWDSNSHEYLNKMVNDFLIENDVEIINISFSSVWDPKNACVLFSVCIAYRFDA